MKGDAQTNESTALPALLRRLNRTGAVVTMDALGCQVELARQIQDPGADSMLSVTETQPTLYNDGGDGLAWLRSPQPLAPPGTLG